MATPCPRCREPMTPWRYGALEIDRCAACDGIFLDKGELEVITRRGWGGRLDSSIFSRALVPEGQAICPRCDVAMIELHAAADVRVDWCPGCEGLFLDRGELATLHHYDPEA